MTDEDDGRHGWTHPMCEQCWRQTNEGRIPVRVKQRYGLVCCFCGAWTWGGIFVRARAGSLGMIESGLSFCPDWKRF